MHKDLLIIRFQRKQCLIDVLLNQLFLQSKMEEISSTRGETKLCCEGFLYTKNSEKRV